MPASQFWWDYLEAVRATLGPLLACVVLERLFPIERGQPFRRWLFNVAYLLFALLALLWVGPALGRAHDAVRGLVGGGLITLPPWLGQGPAAQAAVGVGMVSVWDFFQYWAHRAQHAVPFLWETHKLHHSETAVNASTSFRTHLTSHLLFSFVVGLPTSLLLRNFTWNPMVSAVFFTWFGPFNHMNLRLSLGRATPLISGPQLHRLHHSKLEQHRDCNFAALFPVLDILFGTYRAPAKGESPPTGLDSGEQMNDLRSVTVAPLGAWGTALLRVVRR